MSAYVRDEAFAQMSFLFTALNRVLALGGRVAETREFEEEPRAFLQTLASMGALIDAVGSWMALADEQEGLERAANGSGPTFLLTIPSFTTEEKTMASVNSDRWEARLSR